MHLLRRIERHLRLNHIAATRFGRDAANDPRLVLDMRNGRTPGAVMSARINHFLDRFEAEQTQ